MEENKNNDVRGSAAITDEEFREFLSATDEDRLNILLSHAEKNNKTIRLRRFDAMSRHGDRNTDNKS